MARKRSLNRDRAFEIYKENGGNITNREIASLLGEDEKVIAVWKSRDKWNVVQQSKQSCTTNKKGAPPGNQNAVDNNGGAPPGNRNALKTGEFETLLFDTLEEDEISLVNLIRPDKHQLLLQEIRLLTVRERRMLKRIEDIRNSEEYLEDKSPAGEFTVVSRKIGIEKGKPTDLLDYRGKLGQIQSIEDALTRVQARKQRAIEALHRYGVDDARLKIELRKLELLVAEANEKELMEDENMRTRVDIYLPEKETDED